MREIVTIELDGDEAAKSWRFNEDTELTVLAGLVWLTLAADAYDYWLKPGERQRLPAGARAWIGAYDGAARISLPLAWPRRGGRGARLVRVIRGWWSRRVRTRPRYNAAP